MTVPMTEVRQRFAAMLRAELPNDVAVHDSIPDSVAPPAVFVTWANPWLISTSWCEFTAQIQLLVVTQRIEPGGQYGVIEQMVFDLVQILRDNKVALRDVTSPYPLSLAGVDYLAASVNVLEDMESR